LARDESDRDWRLPLSHKAYTIETMCRILYTAKYGRIANKADSVEWALAWLPENWRKLVKRSQDWRTSRRVDLAENPAVRGFVLWTTQEVQKTVHEDASSQKEGA
jgi:hypothetical protein